MSTPRLLRLSLIASLGFLCAMPMGNALLVGQSGTKGRISTRRPPPPKMTDEERKQYEPKPASLVDQVVRTRPILALDGYDPVVFRESKQLVAGSQAQSEVFDGCVFRFSSEDTRRRFQQNRAVNMPALGGFSVVALRDAKQFKLGSSRSAAVYADRIFLFADAAERDVFLKTPADYANVDLVLDGLSPVTLVESKQLRPGSPQHMVIYDGRRIFLGDETERQKFVANPGTYYPTLGGLDPVALFEGEVVKGVPNFAVRYKERLYVLSSVKNRDKFVASPVYSDVDVVNDGKCPVTQVETGKLELGHYGFTAVLLGRRFQFVSEAHRFRFEQDPAKYFQAVEASRSPAAQTGQPSEPAKATKQVGNPAPTTGS